MQHECDNLGVFTLHIMDAVILILKHIVKMRKLHAPILSLPTRHLIINLAILIYICERSVGSSSVIALVNCEKLAKLNLNVVGDGHYYPVRQFV